MCWDDSGNDLSAFGFIIIMPKTDPMGNYLWSLITNSDSTVFTYVSIFETLWAQTEHPGRA